MRGTSQASRDAVLKGFEPVVNAAGAESAVLAAEIFTVVDALDSSGSLRRALTDPARPGTDKASLVKELFGTVDPRVIDVASDLVHARWSHERDLGDSLEAAGMEALLGAADAAGRLDAVEEELFRVERMLAAERDLRVALDDRTGDPAKRRDLLTSVFGKSLASETLALLERAAFAPRDRRVSASLTAFIAAAAGRRDRSVANVVSAVELSAKQRARLTSILANAYGREIQLNVAIQPGVLGGIRVQVGHEVVDGTVLSRLDEARRRLVG